MHIIRRLKERKSERKSKLSHPCFLIPQNVTREVISPGPVAVEVTPLNMNDLVVTISRFVSFSWSTKRPIVKKWHFKDD